MRSPKLFSSTISFGYVLKGKKKSLLESVSHALSVCASGQIDHHHDIFERRCVDCDRMCVVCESCFWAITLIEFNSIFFQGCAFLIMKNLSQHIYLPLLMIYAGCHSLCALWLLTFHRNDTLYSLRFILDPQLKTLTQPQYKILPRNVSLNFKNA